MKTFIISDTHFSHTNIIKYTSRPFKSVEEMNEVMINRWNSIVTEKDQVYMLGDFCLAKSNDECEKIFYCLNGKKFLIIGNHDSNFAQRGLKWEKTFRLCEIRHNNVNYVLCHYPIETWNKKHHGAIHLHGHVHEKTNHMKNRYNMSVELWNYSPVELERIPLDYCYNNGSANAGDDSI